MNHGEMHAFIWGKDAKTIPANDAEAISANVSGVLVPANAWSVAHFRSLECCSDPPSTRAGGQDDVSLNKLPQIIPYMPLCS